MYLVFRPQCLCYGVADFTHQNEEKPKACDFPFGELDVRDGLLLPDQYVKGEYLHIAPKSL